MKSNVCAVVLVCLAAAAFHLPTAAQDAAADPFSKIVVEMFQMNGGKTWCADASTTVPSTRAAVLTYLNASGLTDGVTGKTIAAALWHLFPCPFSPAQAELRPASSKEIEGAWLLPETSQKLRFGPRSPRQ